MAGIAVGSYSDRALTTGSEFRWYSGVFGKATGCVEHLSKIFVHSCKQSTDPTVTLARDVLTGLGEGFNTFNEVGIKSLKIFFDPAQEAKNIVKIDREAEAAEATQDFSVMRQKADYVQTRCIRLCKRVGKLFYAISTNEWVVERCGRLGFVKDITSVIKSADFISYNSHLVNYNFSKILSKEGKDFRKSLWAFAFTAASISMYVIPWILYFFSMTTFLPYASAAAIFLKDGSIYEIFKGLSKAFGLLSFHGYRLIDSIYKAFYEGGQFKDPFIILLKSLLEISAICMPLVLYAVVARGFCPASMAQGAKTFYDFYYDKDAFNSHWIYNSVQFMRCGLDLLVKDPT